MECTKCGNQEVLIERKASGQALCKDCFIKSIEKKVISTIKKENFIEKGDKVLVALSGGKDSVVTIEILNSYVKRHIIELCAVTVDEGIEGYSNKCIKISKEHTKRLGVPHKIVSFKDTFGITIDDIMSLEEHRGSCTYCGVFRRWIINKVAREFGVTKIVTGHNLDDEIQAIMMNYFEGNVENLAKMGPKTESKSELFTVKIKPLREVPEHEIALYAKVKCLKIHNNSCPYTQASFRKEVANILKGLSKEHPTIMYSTLRGFDKIRPAIKSEINRNYEFDRCERCGEPSSNRLCRACVFLEELGK